MKKIKVAIVGTGNIGTDLLMKIQRSAYLKCSLFSGRNITSHGIQKALSMGIHVSDKSIDAIIENPEICDVVFDATSAQSHFYHAPILEALGKFVVDLTPAKVGHLCVPTVNLQEGLEHNNVNMVTCGGQASIPLASALSSVHENIEYIETVSTISSKSAGPATRRNLDEYIHTTEKGIQKFSGAREAKAILNLNPAIPPIMMQTTVWALIENPKISKIKDAVSKKVKAIQNYLPGYQLVVEPTLDNGRVFIMVRVEGQGDYLPTYAGNLDIINAAAIEVAEQYARKE